MIVQQLYPGMTVAISEGIFDEPLQQVIDDASNSQSAVKLSGMFKRTEPLILRTNTYLSGDMYGFTSGIRPYDCPAIIMDGHNVTGGFCFNNVVKDLSIWLDGITQSIPYAILSRNSYRSKFECIRFMGGSVSDALTNNLLHIDGIQNMNDYTKIFASGKGNSGSGSAIRVSNTGGKVVLNMPDVEGSFKGIDIQSNARVDIYSPYTERCGVAIDINAGMSPEQTPTVNIYGGSIDLASATSTGIRLMGDFSHGEIINIIGTSFSSTDHLTKKGAFKLGNSTWSGSHKINISGIDWSWIDFPEQLQAISVITPVSPV